MRFDNKDNYPPHNKLVFIEYWPYNEDRYIIDKAWLTVDDEGKYVWILENDNTIDDDQVINWTDYKNKK